MQADIFIEYFRDIAIHLKDIAHTAEKPQFTRMNIEEVFSGLTGGLDMTKNCMILEMYEGTYTDNNSDNIMDNQSSAFMILRNAAQGDFTEQDIILRDTKIIFEKILAKIRKDKRTFPKTEGNRFNGLIKNFDFNTVRYQKVGPIFDSCYGFRVEFSFFESKGFVFNPADWTYV